MHCRTYNKDNINEKIMRKKMHNQKIFTAEYGSIILALWKSGKERSQIHAQPDQLCNSNPSNK